MVRAPAGAVFEQHHRARPPSYQTTSECQARVPRIPFGATNDSGLRSDPHAAKGTGSMGERD